MRFKLLQTAVGRAARAIMPARQIVTRVNRPLLHNNAAQLNSDLTAHARFVHATALLEKRKKRPKEVEVERMHGRQHCDSKTGKKHPCQFEYCYCIPGTYKEVKRHCKKPCKKSHKKKHGKHGKH